MVFVDDMRWDDARPGHPSSTRAHRPGRASAPGPQRVRHDAALLPSRASFLTGQYAHTHGTKITGTPQPHLRTFPAELRRAGHRTVYLASGTSAMTTGRVPATTGWPCPVGAKPSTRHRTSTASGTREGLRPISSLTTSSASSSAPPVGLPRVPGTQGGSPDVVQKDDGSLVPIPGQPAGFVAAERHRRRYVGRPMPRRASASSRRSENPRCSVP